MNSMIDDKYNRYYENKEKKNMEVSQKNVLPFIVFFDRNRHLRANMLFLF